MKVHGIPVYFDPACRTVAQAHGVWPFYRIAVGPEWYSHDARSRVALVMHEVGHCRGHHMLARLATLPLLLMWRLGEQCGLIARALTHQQELAADRFAADQGYSLELAQALAAYEPPESPFYPSNAVRASILMARHFKEKFPC